MLYIFIYLVRMIQGAIGGTGTQRTPQSMKLIYRHILVLLHPLLRPNILCARIPLYSCTESGWPGGSSSGGVLEVELPY